MKEDFLICSKLQRENFWFSLEANPVGCQNNYLLVPKGILRKLFSIERKLIFLKCGSWAKKTWPLAQFFSAVLTKLDSSCLEEPFEKNFLRRKFFPSTCLDREQKNSASWIKFLAKMSKLRFRCPQEQFEETAVWNFAKFSISFGQWAKSLCWTKQVRGIAESCRKPLSSAKIYWGGPFDVSETLWIRKTKNISQASRSFSRSLLSHSDKISVYGTFCRYMPVFDKDCTCVH